jgi:hypothetical protein
MSTSAHPGPARRRRRTLVVAAAAAAPLVLAAPAGAGCMATVGLLTPPPAGLAAGGSWSVDLRVMQHGVTPMPDATPAVLLRAPDGTVSRTAATPTATVGVYHADVRVPAAGSYGVAVEDGFPVPECRQTHTFAELQVAAAPTAAGGEGDGGTPAAAAEPAQAAPASGGSGDDVAWLAGAGVAGAALAAAAIVGVRRWRAPREERSAAPPAGA